ncbi:MAG: energy-coupled thiamine transporter ThiT [Clostridia bacterium]|nr:energy-coupled thiamine transporter ThiT [Clostridia bacterium]
MYNLLALNEQQITNLYIGISVALIVLALVLVLILGRKTVRFTAKKLAFVAVSVALTTVLSLIKFEMPFLNGGSITLFSLVPVLLVSYAFGLYYGLITGFITGLLQFITSPWALTPLSFFLDYILPYSCVCFAGVFKKNVKNQTLAISLGTVFSYLVRFVMHFLSGLNYYSMGYITEGFPADNMFIYSFVYNLAYVMPDMVICLIFLIPFTFTKPFKTYFLTGENFK